MGRRGRRILLGALLAVLAGGLAVWAVVVRPLLPAWRFLEGLGGPVPTERTLLEAGGTRSPRDGPPTFRYLPAAGEAPAPVFVVVAGVTPQGVDDPRVWRLLLGLRAAGFAVLAPEVPALRRLGEDHDGVARVREALALASGAARPGSALRGADPRRIGLLGVSLGGALALRAAATSSVDVRALVLVGAPDDPRALAGAWFREPVAGAGARVDEQARSSAGLFARHGVLRAAAGPLLDSSEAEAVRAWIDAVGEAPAATGPPPPAVASAAGTRWLRAALAEDRAEAGDVTWLLGAAEADLGLHAPAAWDADLGRLRAPVWLVHGTDDPLVPVGEMDRLAARLATRTRVITLASTLLTHVDVGTPALAEAWRHLRTLTDAFDAVRETRP